MTASRICASPVARLSARSYLLPSHPSVRKVSSSSNAQKPDVEGKSQDVNAQAGGKSETKPKPKTQAQLDDELKAKMAGISGEGGEAGIEYENGEPVAMKRSVRNNMFRYI
ncbi:uncharacterized protein BKCO1_400014 [Diplodia corticola]|uniref:Uncharacterized protein n=1 Tax=Diplodia corticola TaxID=236234 RepID=A0A1J9RF53_9PEZI|nr:uncharacterized protein BKCO1_400014 [Diplodia corticola]OJD38722.1 hypothetical protein BKCO1_400014 [Diplodia corticola]